MSDLRSDALDYHRRSPAGKLQVLPTKPTRTQHDLALAYTPGVAEPCREIAANPDAAYEFTNRGNLIAVISNGTAVLGLGDIGPLAGKPVMEGKCVLFKRFADIDAFDLELDVRDPDALIETVAALAPSFGGINLEDIKAPECFVIEAALRARLDIPVMHDDQHGTAIVAGAALLNALEIAGKQIRDIRLVVSGAGAAALGCVRLWTEVLGLPREHVMLVDSRGVVYAGRENLTPEKAAYAIETPARTLADALSGADVFLGVSVGGTVTAEMLRTMAPSPILFALANPTPEIGYEAARAARPDAIVATGRSDFPNQVNNVLGFPAIFRGALDCRASDISDGMKRAAVEALAALAHEPVPKSVLDAYAVDALAFGPDYLLPKPVDTRVVAWLAPAIARAAAAEGLARAPINDLDAYATSLSTRMDAAHALLSRLDG